MKAENLNTIQDITQKLLGHTVKVLASKISVYSNIMGRSSTEISDEFIARNVNMALGTRYPAVSIVIPFNCFWLCSC